MPMSGAPSSPTRPSIPRRATPPAAARCISAWPTVRATWSPSSSPTTTASAPASPGANFSLDPESDNYLEGGKKAYHTIIPGFLCKDGKAVGPFGVMGGFMQPQGHVQVIVNTVDYHMNPQECLDAPRFQWVGEKKVQLEREVPAHIAQKLADMGHQVEIVNTNLGMGRGEIIWRMEDGTLVGGTEPRADGTIAAW